MKTNRMIVLFFLISVLNLFAGVPFPRTHNPLIPYFMKQIGFQPVLLNVYGSHISGIIPNQYSDLNWNPAFIFNGKGNCAYLDFNYQTPTNELRYSNYHYTNSDMIYPYWYGTTYVTPLQLNPLYNLALVQKISNKISIGIINRTIFDYGPLRSSSYRRSYETSSPELYDRSAYNTLELKTVEVDENQQSVLGTQTEFTLGYKLSTKIDIGVKLGHYIFTQNGEMGDLKYSKQPHSLIDYNSAEDLNVDGNQYEIGSGIIYHYDDKTDIGVFASFMSGSSSETNLSSVRKEYWSEKPTDSKYYSISKRDLTSNHSYISDGTSPFISLTFHKELSENLTFRSFFSYRLVNKEISSVTFATDTSFSEHTFDYRENNVEHFSKDVNSTRGRSNLNGNGNETSKNLKWFASLIYKTQDSWTAFGAIMLTMETKDISLFERSTYYHTYDRKRYYYRERTTNYLNSHIKNYQYDHSFTKWSIFLPIGIKAHIYGGFSCLIGTNLQFDIVNIKETGSLLYPERISRTTENGIVTSDDIEINRPESYTGNRPTEFTKTSTIQLGAIYEHSSGLNLYIKTEGNIFNKSFWTFGVEYAY